MRRLFAVLGICAAAGSLILAQAATTTPQAPPSLAVQRKVAPVPAGTPMLSVDGIMRDQRTADGGYLTKTGPPHTQ